eukprot:5442591-Amphidinium_carterae.2
MQHGELLSNDAPSIGSKKLFAIVKAKAKKATKCGLQTFLWRTVAQARLGYTCTVVLSTWSAWCPPRGDTWHPQPTIGTDISTRDSSQNLVVQTNLILCQEPWWHISHLAES